VTIRERAVEAYLVDRIKEAGGFTRKLKWLDRRSAPDRFASHPRRGPFLVEVKRPGEEPTPAQAREHKRLRAAGVTVWTVDCLASADRLVDWMVGGC
jgi:hypothetical protein